MVLLLMGICGLVLRRWWGRGPAAALNGGDIEAGAARGPVFPRLRFGLVFRFPRLRVGLVWGAIALLLVAGCGKKEKTAAEMDAAELLNLLHERQHVDAHNFVEVDLGRYRVSHKVAGAEGALYVQFHLFGIVSTTREKNLAEILPKFEKRTRDAVISLVQRSETEHLCEPSLALLKEEVAATVNRILRERLLIDVVFSDYSTDKEAGIPWSIPPGAEPKKESGGHGGGHH